MDFYAGMSTVAFLRDIGKHFRLATMLSRDSVKSRLHAAQASNDAAEGMSFTEFSYQVLQAYDFYRLFVGSNCLCQVGGSDQWGNIVSGTDYIKRRTGKEAFGVTIPLLVNSKGEKFGKSTGGGSLWLDSTKTPPYQLYQYLLNVQDEEVEGLLLRLTFLPIERIAEVMDEQCRAPERRIAQTLLASSVLEMVHGEDALRAVKGSTNAFFSAEVDQICQMNES